MPGDPLDFQTERAKLQQRELGRADPMRHLIDAENTGMPHGHPMRDSHERVALVEAVMLLTHRVGELTRHVARLSKREDSDG